MECMEEIVPLFPLTKIVFFPQTLLPLYIYEPRYQEMIRDSLKDDRRIAIGVMRDGWEKEYHGAPPVFKTVSIGHIIDDERLSDGKYNIHVQGIERAHIMKELDYAPYRKVLVRDAKEFIGHDSRKELLTATKFLINLLERLIEYMPNRKTILQQIFSQNGHPGIIADQVAFHFVEDKYDKQSILSELNVLRRIKLVTIQVQNILVHLARQHFKDIL